MPASSNPNDLVPSDTTLAQTWLDDGGRAIDPSHDELTREFRELVEEGGALLRSMTNLSGDALVRARARFRGRLAGAKSRLIGSSGAAVGRGRQVAAAADNYARTNPWPAIGIAAGVGFLIGLLATRR